MIIDIKLIKISTRIFLVVVLSKSFSIARAVNMIKLQAPYIMYLTYTIAMKTRRVIAHTFSSTQYLK